MRKSSDTIDQKMGSPGFLERIEADSGEKVRVCYQCGKCSAGCPVAYSMDLLPNQLMRLVQLGLKDEVLSCSTIWLCASCETCATRCPREIGIVHVMDALRHMARREHYPVQVREVPLFVSTFISNLKRFGRLWEAGFVGIFNVRSGHLTKDMGKAPGMLRKRKLALLPPKVKGMNRIRKMLKKVEEVNRQ